MFTMASEPYGMGRLPATAFGRTERAMHRLRWLRIVAGLLGVAASSGSAHAAAPPLTELQVIPLAGVERRIDHFAVDAAGNRLFVGALGNGTLEVLDVAAGKRITSIPGLKEPQGVAYLPSVHRIVAAMRGGGVQAFDDRNYQPVTTMPGMSDADNLRFDAAANQLYVGYGEGALGLIDPASMTRTADIPLPAHPESFRLEENGPRIFVNVPTTREILVVDRGQRSIIGHIPLGNLLNNYPMSLDESGHRLFVGVRQPARLLMFDTVSNKQIAAVPCVGDTDDLFYDAKRDRVYVIGGEGFVDTFDASPSGTYARIGRHATRPGARTGLWSPELDRLFVASPLRNGHQAEIHVLAPGAGTP
jgi:YVTN family beta-propeller protein